MQDALPDDDLSRITNLESQAEQLKTLIEGAKAPRPLIIEFSGLPKSGKTSLISVLQLFLKRNGIKTEVYTERASISPIKKKGHLEFNVWVSCASLEGMLEALFKDIDVFILDRGIFDALVWNEWLKMTGKITEEEGAEVGKFFSMARWTDLVDLVFVFRCDPATSIKREHADQLTTKRGTIMDETTLAQLNECIDKTIIKNGAKFKKVSTMDTTGTETKQTAAKVAAVTLETLNTFLDESICVVPVSAVTTGLPSSGLVSDPSAVRGFLKAIETDKKFLLRSKAEKDANFLQPIPCAVMEYDGKILLLKRKKRGHPLHDTYAVWAGGHVSSSDEGSDILENALRREISEELFIKEAFDLDPTPIALVRTQEDERASLHIGVVYRVTLRSQHIALAMNQKEFRETRGSSMSGRLIELDKIPEYYQDMGDWSKFIVDFLWADQAPPKPQGTLFEK
jgi:predicted NUDIX family phosphoesterase